MRAQPRAAAAEQEYGLSGIRAMLDDAPCVEILSDEHRSLPVREALDRAAAGARRRLELAGPVTPPP